MSLEKEPKYLFRAKIDNPRDAARSPWHVAITKMFPDRVTLTNPNDRLVGRAEIDELIETCAIPLVGRDGESVEISPDIVGRLVEIVEVPEIATYERVANPFET